MMVFGMSHIMMARVNLLYTLQEIISVEPKDTLM